MDPALPTRLPLEMLHRVRDVNLAAIDPRFLERPIEHLSSGAHERFAGHVFLDLPAVRRASSSRSLRAFAENGLRSVL